MIYTFKTPVGVYTVCNCMNTSAEARERLAEYLWKDAGYSREETGAPESWVELARALGV